MKDHEIKDIYQRAEKQALRERDFPAVKRVIEEAIASQGKAVNSAIAERKRQVEVEGFSPERDDSYDSCELAAAAACYAFGSEKLEYAGVRIWPWGSGWFKYPEGSGFGPYRQGLVKATALLLAEIERVDRADAAEAFDAEVELCPS